MDHNEFEVVIAATDTGFAAEKMPAKLRPMFAWMKLTGCHFYGGMRPRPESPAFEGENLYFKIEEWYGKVYPDHSTVQVDWGHRWFIIRGEYYRARIPVIFNPTMPIDPFEHLEGFTAGLRSLLKPQEEAEIIQVFNVFLLQSHDINHCLIYYVFRRDVSLERNLLDRGWSDLVVAGKSFQVADPTASLFTIQQAAEKYLKALLVKDRVVETEKQLSRQFGHSIEKLLKACQVQAPMLNCFTADIHALGYGPDVRYHRPQFSAMEVIGRFNLAFAICYRVAQWFLVKQRSAKQGE